MIDEKTGELISENGVVIGPNLKRDSFLASEIGVSSKIFVRNEPWCSYRIEGLKISGLVFVVVLYFYGLDLNEIEICNSDVRFGETWSDWSLENELKRKQSHDKWLDQIIGSKRNFSWGDIFSVYDQRSGGSSIKIRYKR